jgi:hypothetical protein
MAYRLHRKHGRLYFAVVNREAGSIASEFSGGSRYVVFAMLFGIEVGISESVKLFALSPSGGELRR